MCPSKNSAFLGFIDLLEFPDVGRRLVVEVCLNGECDIIEPWGIASKVVPDPFLQFVASCQTSLSLCLIDWIEAAEVHQLHVNAVGIAKVCSFACRSTRNPIEQTG